MTETPPVAAEEVAAAPPVDVLADEADDSTDIPGTVVSTDPATGEPTEEPGDTVTGDGTGEALPPADNDDGDIELDVTDPPATDNGTVTDMTRGEEVAARTTDTDEGSIHKYIKRFLLHIPFSDELGLTDEVHTAHAANVAESAIHSGLRITGDITFKGAEPSGQYGHAVYADGTPVQYSTMLTYEADAVPAHLLGAGPTEETTDVAGVAADAVSPRDVLEAADEDQSVEEHKDEQEEPA